MAGATDFFLIVGLSVITATLAIRFAMGQGSALRTKAIPPPDAPALLFSDGILHHGSNRLMARLTLMPGQSTLSDASEQLSRQFPALPQALTDTAEGTAIITASAKDDPAQLHLRWRDNLCWITCSDGESERAAPKSADRQQTFSHLSLHAKTAPVPAWLLDPQQKVVWFNERYRQLLSRTGQKPHQPLFPLPADSTDRRAALGAPGQDVQEWYQIEQVAQGGLTMCHALPCSDLVAAEVAQRNFVQTLAKTFAHLSIGLAIFDREGRLALFNPALLDLTGLPAQFLSGKPSALSFFDALRENRHMPEPKNYKSWRQDIADVIAAASDGSYKEVWSLENGRTYSVIGRPHPDGATAFMIEDISAEVTLTRNFRSELELSQAVLDTFDCGIVVFSATGFVTFTNAAYRQLWQHDPEAAFADVSLQDCIDHWSHRAGPGPNWPQLEAHVMDYTNRKTLQLPIRFSNGADYMLELCSLSPDANMIRFSRAPAEAAEKYHSLQAV